MAKREIRIEINLRLLAAILLFIAVVWVAVREGGGVMTLEELLTQAAARGLTHLALYPVNSLDKQKTYWTATAAPSSGHHYVRGTDLDPVVALKTALTDLPKAKLRAPPAKLKSDVTVAVTEPQPADPDPAEDWKLRP